MKNSSFVGGLLAFVLFFSSAPIFSAQVMDNRELDGITGQSGIVCDVFLVGLVDEDYKNKTATERSEVREAMSNLFSFLTEDEIDEIIETQLMITEKIRDLPLEQQKEIKLARDTMREELGTSSQEELLKMINDERITAEDLTNATQDQSQQMIIAQSIVENMIQTLPQEQQTQFEGLQQLVQDHFENLRR